MANVPVLIRTVSDALPPVPVGGVLARIYSALGVFLTEGTTDSLTGEITFTLSGDAPGVTHLVRLSKNGYSFPTDPTKTILVKDPAVPANEVQFSSHQGSTAQLVTISVKTDALVPVQVNDVEVWIYTAGDVYITQGFTGHSPDAAGQFNVPLEGSSGGTDYLIRLRKSGYEFLPRPTQVINVLDPVVPPATNIFDVVVHQPTLPESTDPDMCLVSGYMVDASLRPFINKNVRFWPRKGFPDYMHIPGMYYPSDPSVVRDRIIVKEVIIPTNSQGYLTVSLPRDSWFDIHIPGAEDPRLIITSIYIPDLAGFRLEELLFPYVTTVDYSETDVSVGIDESVLVDVTGSLSNTRDLSIPDDLVNLLTFTPEDEAIANVVLDSEGKLKITGLAAGTTTIAVARIPGTAAPRRPVLVDIIAPTLTVQVA